MNAEVSVALKSLMHKLKPTAEIQLKNEFSAAIKIYGLKYIV